MSTGLLAEDGQFRRWAGFKVHRPRVPQLLVSIVYCECSTNAGRVLTHEQILQRVWGRPRTGDARAIRTHLMRLLRKLGEDATSPKHIFAGSRVGYRMTEDETSEREES